MSGTHTKELLTDRFKEIGGYHDKRKSGLVIVE